MKNNLLPFVNPVNNHDIYFNFYILFILNLIYFYEISYYFKVKISEVNDTHLDSNFTAF